MNDGFRAGAGGRIIVDSLLEGESDRELLEIIKVTVNS